jgi:hypothetical protein
VLAVDDTSAVRAGDGRGRVSRGVVGDDDLVGKRDVPRGGVNGAECRGEEPLFVVCRNDE